MQECAKLTKPQPSPVPSPQAIASQSGALRWSNSAVTTAAKPNTAPTDMSISPAISVRPTPIERKPKNVRLCRMPVRFSIVRK